MVNKLMIQDIFESELGQMDNESCLMQQEFEIIGLINNMKEK